MMSTSARGAAVLLAFAGLTSCVPPPYAPPTPDQPHAVMKVRRVYERTAGQRLLEHCRVTGHEVLRTADPVELASSPRTDAFLVHPIPARLEVKGTFVHSEILMVDETYTEQEPYFTTQLYSCGFGTMQSTCTRMVTQYRTVTKHRMVTKPVDVVDGSCARSVDLAPVVGGSYLLDFTYRENAECSLTCVQQTSGPDSTFANAPCARLTAAQLQLIEPEP
jgi:hypothetical protein